MCTLIYFLVLYTLQKDSIEKNRSVGGTEKKRPAEGQKRPTEGTVPTSPLPDSPPSEAA